MDGGRQAEQDGCYADSEFWAWFGASVVAHATDWQQVKSNESPITRIFGGKFRSTLRAPHQRDSVMVEDWRALQLDIQVCVAA